MFELVKKRFREGMDILYLTYRYENYLIDIEVDIRGQMMPQYTAKNQRSKDISFTKVGDLKPRVLVEYFSSDNQNETKIFSEEVADAAALLSGFSELEHLVEAETRKYMTEE